MKYIQKQTPPPSNLNYFLRWVNDNAVPLGLLSGKEQWERFRVKNEITNLICKILS